MALSPFLCRPSVWRPISATGRWVVVGPSEEIPGIQMENGRYELEAINADGTRRHLHGVGIFGVVEVNIKVRQPLRVSRFL